MHRLLPIRLTMALLFAAAAIADADTANSAPKSAPTTTASYAGTFSDGRLTVVLGVAPPEKSKPGEYVGTFTLEGKTYDASAAAKEKEMTGTFRVGGNPFRFTAWLEDGGLMLQSADLTYHLKDITPPAAAATTMPATVPAAALPATLPAS